MELKLSIIFTTILLIFFLCLSVHAAMTRRKSKIPLGEEKNENLIRAVRAHGNFLEYTPLFIISFIIKSYNKFNTNRYSMQSTFDPNQGMEGILIMMA